MQVVAGKNQHRSGLHLGNHVARDAAGFVGTAGVDTRIGEAELPRHRVIVIVIVVAGVQHVDDADVRPQVTVRHAVVAGTVYARPAVVGIDRPARQGTMREHQRPRVHERGRVHIPVGDLAHLGAAAASKHRRARHTGFFQHQHRAPTRIALRGQDGIDQCGVERVEIGEAGSGNRHGVSLGGNQGWRGEQPITVRVKLPLHTLAGIRYDD